MKSIDISGMGGHYERCCQAMLIAGVEWLKEHPEFTFQGYQSYGAVLGSVRVPDDPLPKELDKVLWTSVQGDMSPVQHHTILDHLHYIHTHGYDVWLQDAIANGMTEVEVDPDEIVKQLAVDLAEWNLKIDSGWDPLAELLKDVPPDHIIHINSNDPDSIQRAMGEFGEKLKEDLENKEKEE